MGIVSIKHNDIEFAALENDGTITLTCAGLPIVDNIIATIEEFDGGLLEPVPYNIMLTKTNSELQNYKYMELGV